MSRCEKLSERFYAMDLYYGKANTSNNRNFQCFFIVEHPCNEEFIQEQALMFLASHCISFDFYGKESLKWKQAFDMLIEQIHPNKEDKNIVLSGSHSNLDDFVELLIRALSERPFVPCDIFLIYDDENIYKSVLNKLTEKE